MPLAKLGVPLVDPAAAGLAVALDALAPAQIPARAHLQDRVVARVEREREAARVGSGPRRGHDGWVEDGDEGAGGQFPEAGVGCGEEVEVERPFEVCERKYHEFPPRVHLAVRRFAKGGRGCFRGFVTVFVRERRRFGRDDAEYYEVVFEGLGERVDWGFDCSQERGDQRDVFLR